MSWTIPWSSQTTVTTSLLSGSCGPWASKCITHCWYFAGRLHSILVKAKSSQILHSAEPFHQNKPLTFNNFCLSSISLYSSCLGLSMCAMPLACWWMVFRCFTLLSHFSFLCGFPKGSLVWFGLVGYMRHPRWCSAPKTIYPGYWQKILQATLWSQRSCLLWLSFWLQ